ncbi:MAG: efflux RND transporter periplasmic adaptor subunit [Verrucomicrobiota bacterium]
MNDEAIEIEEKERKGSIHAVMSFVLALVLILVGFGGLILFVVNKVKASQEEPKKIIPSVAVALIEPKAHEVRISTQGIVESRREVMLAAEVGGRVAAISPQLVDGGRVKRGDLLVEIDQADYVAGVARAKASLADAELALEVEKARAKQALRDWDKLGQGEAPALVLREPQIASAEARIVSSSAEVERAERDLERTRIVAPFDGRVRTAEVEEGAVVMPGARVGEIYSDRDLEVRLPFSLRDFGYLGDGAGGEFELRATMGNQKKHWPAKIDRIEGEVERSTLSGHGIARVMAAEDGSFPPVGLFVESVVPGVRLEDVVEIPRSAVRGQNTVWVENGGVLTKREVEILRSRREHLITRGNFEDGDRLVLTRLEAPLEGMKVNAEDGE